MKRTMLCLLLILIAYSQLSFAGEVNAAHSSKKEMRGIWVTTVLNLDYPRTPTDDPQKLKDAAVEIITNAKNMGFNAIFLQVRPNADALYPSKLAPWSEFLTGERGKAPKQKFDPLQFWIEECKRQGVELHAWLNPYRVGTNDKGVKKEWMVPHSDGKKYLNPGLPDVRDHIVQIIEELIDNYELDGIHFDDYFYPGREFDDGAAYRTYGKGKKLDDWRLDNVNELIRLVHETIQKRGKGNVSFGISPFGIWANNSTHDLGSNTAGSESLTVHYADTRRWVKEEWIDYIAPQIYWHIGFAIADYETLVKWWADVVRGTNVSLYIGIAGYRALNEDENSPWYGIEQIHKQLDLNKVIPEVEGSIHFRYTHYTHPRMTSLMKAYFNGEYQNPNLGNRLAVGRPNSDVTVNAEKFFLGGTSDPSKPLYLNGKLVEGRTKLGYFGVYVDLNPGENAFVFTQGTQRYVRTITRKEPSYQTYYADGITKAFPTVPKAYLAGQEFELACVAPGGTRVYATLDGIRYELKQEVAVTDGEAVWFSKKMKFEPKGQPRWIILGHIRYECYDRNGKLLSDVTSDKRLEIIMKGAPLIATIVTPDVDSYLDNSRQIGSFHLMNVGMKDYVIEEDGDIIKLASGIWVKTSGVAFSEVHLPKNVLKTVLHDSVEGEEKIHFSSVFSPIAYVDQEGDTLYLTLNATKIDAKLLKIKDNPLMKEMKLLDDGRVAIVLKKPELLSGSYLKSEKNGTTLILRHKKVVANSTLPLQGTLIMIDPGHGGSDSGSLSLHGSLFPEKDLVLWLSYRLKAMLEERGATVVMTRFDDTYVSLHDRLRFSKLLMPDLFLSMHTDSLYETRDLSKVKGITAFYKHENAMRLSDQIAKTVYDNSPMDSRGSKYYNFYVCRGTWTPSILLESGFSCNPFDINFLMTVNDSEKLLQDYVADIIRYFKTK